ETSGIPANLKTGRGIGSNLFRYRLEPTKERQPFPRRKSRLRRGPARIEALAGVAMYTSEFTAWYRRMSVVYGIGVWSVLGSLLYYSRTMAKSSVNQKDGLTTETPSELSEHPKGFYVETVVTYKEDFVPIREKILNYWKSWTGGPGAEP
ncbi:hypothetical protein H8957_017783, partial [Semnopithecus entellus]